MEGNRNWAGWAALALAGLALFVALSGRLNFQIQIPDQQPQSIVMPAQAVPVAPPAPGSIAPQGGATAPSKLDQSLQAEIDKLNQLREQLKQAPDQPVVPDVPDVPTAPQFHFKVPQAPQAIRISGGPFGWNDGPFGSWFFTPFRMIPDLLQLLGLLVVLWVAVRLFRSRGGRPGNAARGPLSGPDPQDPGTPQAQA